MPLPNPTATSASSASSRVKKIIVAVHGIGDQVRNETILSTAVRFCDHYGYEGLVSLGAFTEFPPEPGKAPPPEPALFIDDPPPFQPCPGLTGTIGFVEVHWADLARKVSTDGYMLQETKAWARTLVQRMRVYATHRNPANANIDYRRIGEVLEEIIDTVRVIEALLFLSNKAGLGEFKLREMLDAFVGDVQLVTEFAPIRAGILQRFTDAMAAIHAKYPDAQIHIVAHSEGTVVAFLGLLEADLDINVHPWISQVRGFMTLGSPIDKHLILWPRLFERYKGPSGLAGTTIRWVNYVDYADPVGFDLDTARDWLRQRGYLGPPRYQQLFAFDEKEDFSFRRYPVPGKAHVDYWTDPAVFGDFIGRVVDAPPASAPAATVPNISAGPPSRWWVPFVTYGFGYLLPLLVLHLGAYVLCKAVYDYLDPKDELGHPNFVLTVLALSWLIAGTTVWLRLVRLTRKWRFFFLGLALYVVFAAAFFAAVQFMDPTPDPAVAVTELGWFEVCTRVFELPLGFGALAGSLAVVLLVLLVNAPWWRRWWHAFAS
ncbi:hypothetical protein [Opitutus terrae]|uniref:Transmembrane protein n=1 Tax=Opitutus terrae (strain DSM 11246 / JCM 15787 / PB90-1) TaxID=452637 RepID=B1ZMP0_OPITP|nr:hypothetical protein [Opitutus terrae]ACB74384.1 hypothetical protein Oter_1096 [Opitutus terrae PB90-1]